MADLADISSCGLTEAPTRVEGGWAARLRVDQDDPFFFDHPLDHLPGILLVLGLLDLARTAGAGIDLPGHRLSLSLCFHRFCELTDDISLRAGSAAEDGQWTLSARAGAEPKCDGWLGLVPAAPPARLAPGILSRPAPGHLVHRARPENVLVSEVSWDGPGLWARVLRPPAGHLLARRRDGLRGAGGTPGGRGAEELIEAARQLTTMGGKLAYRKPADVKFIMQAIEAELPSNCPAAADVWLSWLPAAGRGSRFRFDIEVRGSRDGAAHPGGHDPQLGRVVLDVRIVTPAAYRALRRRSVAGRVFPA